MDAALTGLSDTWPPMTLMAKGDGTWRIDWRGQPPDSVLVDESGLRPDEVVPGGEPHDLVDAKVVGLRVIEEVRIGNALAAHFDRGKRHAQSARG